MENMGFIEHMQEREIKEALEICGELQSLGEETSKKIAEVLGLEIKLDKFIIQMGAISLLTALGIVEQHWNTRTDRLNLVLTKTGEEEIGKGMKSIKSRLLEIVGEPTDDKIEDEYVTLDDDTVIHVYRRKGSQTKPVESIIIEG